MYRPEIDGLRAIAVLSVLVFHAWPSALPGGFIGVDIFFVISGFLITRNIAQELETGRFSFAEFYRRRIRRIAPMMLVVVAVTLVVAFLLMTPEDMRAVAKSAVWSVASMANIHFWRDLDTSYFARSSNEVPLLHLWSLGVEEQYYLLWPALMVLIWKRMQPDWAIASVAALAAVSFELGRQVYPRDPSFAYYMLPSRAGELLLGSLLGMLSVRGGMPLGGARAASWQGWFGAVLLAGSLAGTNERIPFPGWWALPCTLGTVLVIHATAGGRGCLSAWLGARPMVAVGKISYSAYLWHWPVFAFYRYGYGEPGAGAALTLVAATLALAAASYRLVERPAHRSPAAFARIFMVYLAVPSALTIAIALPVVYAERLGLRLVPQAYADDLAELRARLRPAFQYPWVCQRQRLSEEDLTNPACVLGAQGNGEPEVLLWGDSNAAHYVPMLRVIMERTGARFRNVAVGSCPPMLGDPGPYVEARRLDDCRHSNILVRAALPGYKTVILSVSWSAYMARSPGFIDATERLVRVLVADGHEVILIGKAPVLEGYDRNCAERALRMPLRTCPDLSQRLPESVLDANRQLQQIARRVGAVRYFDGNEWLCPDGICRQFSSDGSPRFIDSSHLTVAASAELGRSVLDGIGLPEAFGRLRAR